MWEGVHEPLTVMYFGIYSTSRTFLPHIVASCCFLVHVYATPQDVKVPLPPTPLEPDAQPSAPSELSAEPVADTSDKPVAASKWD